MDRVIIISYHSFEVTSRKRVYQNIETYLSNDETYAKLTDYETIDIIKGHKIGKYISKVINSKYTSKEGIQRFLFSLIYFFCDFIFLLLN